MVVTSTFPTLRVVQQVCSIPTQTGNAKWFKISVAWGALVFVIRVCSTCPKRSRFQFPRSMRDCPSWIQCLGQIYGNCRVCWVRQGRQTIMHGARSTLAEMAECACAQTSQARKRTWPGCAGHAKRTRPLLQTTGEHTR